MSSQVAANSIDALKDLRVAMVLYGEDTLGALGSIGAEIRRTVRWLHQEQPAYWQEQIKRRRDTLAMAKAELFRRKLASASGTLSTTQQEENVRRAEADVHEAERRLQMTRKWQTQINAAVLEYLGSTRRIKTLASGEVQRGADLLSRLIDSLEAYLQVSPPSGSGSTPASVPSTAAPTPAPKPTPAPAEFEAIATKMIDEEPAAEEPPADEAMDDLLLGGESGENEESE